MDSSPVLFRLRRGQRVQGLTGVVVTTELGKAVVRQPTVIGETALAVAPGDVVYIINYVGEGYWKFWVRGHVDQDQIPGKGEACAGEDQHPVGQLPVASPTACKIQITTEPKTVWWAKVQDARGRVGWTREVDHFGNMDACG